MKIIIMALCLAFSMSCKKNSTQSAPTYNLDPNIQNGYTWGYTTAIRHVSSGITTGNIYNITFSGNTALLTIDGAGPYAFSLTPTSSNTTDAVSPFNGLTSQWSYTVNDTNRTLDLCLDGGTCAQFIR